MQYLVSGGLLVGAIIHLLPLAGVIGAARLGTLYGITVDEPNVEILLRHRAVLFGLLGSVLLLAVFQPQFRSLALGAGIVSTASFLVIARQVGLNNEALSRVIAADIVALLALLIAVAAHLRTTSA